MTAGAVVWFTGFPSSGKSRLASAVRKALVERGVLPCLLDGDVVRGLLVPTPGYSDAARAGFYSTLSNLAAELARQGFVVLVPATAHRREYRTAARRAAPRFVEVWLTTPLEECRSRDAKALYAAASRNPNARVPGAGVDYEPPERAEVLATGGDDAAAVAQVLAELGLALH